MNEDEKLVTVEIERVRFRCFENWLCFRCFENYVLDVLKIEN